MPVGSDVLYALDIGWPRDVVRIEGAGHCEKPLRAPAGGAAHQLLEGRLAVGTIGPEISHVPDRFCGGRLVAVGIYRAIEHPRRARPVAMFEHLQGTAASKGKIEIEAG